MKKLLLCLIVSLCLFWSCENTDEQANGSAEISAVHEHSFVHQTTEPTCESEGKTVYACYCGEAYEEKIPLLEHNITYEYKFSGATVSYTFAKIGRCADCHKEFVEESEISCVMESAGGISLRKVGGLEGSYENGKAFFKVNIKDNYAFKGWSDGVTDTVRTFDAVPKGNIYAIFDFDVKNMPVMSIQTKLSKDILSRDSYLDCNVSISNCDKEFALSMADGSIRVRGNASSNYGDEEYAKTNKVHYRLKFDKKTSVLGINSAVKRKSWVLLRGDGSFVKEPISFYLFDKLTDGKYFTPDFTYVSLYVNGKYMGVYIVCDQIQLGDGRIDIPEKDDDDEKTLKTGYLLEIDNYYGSEPYHFVIDYGQVKLTDMYGVTHTVKQAGYSVKYDSMSQEQLKYVEKFIRNAYTIVYNAVIKNEYFKLNGNNDLIPAPEFSSSMEAVANVLDIDAAAAMYITRELAEERDGGVGSFFMYVDMSLDSPKLTFCAPWDYSWAYGCDSGFEMDKFCVSAWQPQEFMNYAGNRSFTWFITLYKADWFLNKVKDIWTKAKESKTFQSMYAYFEEISDLYEYEFAKNQARWSSGNQAEVSESVISWLKERQKWLDEQWR